MAFAQREWKITSRCSKKLKKSKICSDKSIINIITKCDMQQIKYILNTLFGK